MAKSNTANTTITLGMITKNEERLLPQCLESIKNIADEIIIVDNNSIDHTRGIAKEYGAYVINNPDENDLSKQRNIYLREAKGEWILSLDADERIGKKDIPKIRALTENKEAMAYGFTSRLYTRTWDLLNDWFACSGEYPIEENFSGCPGYLNMYWGYRLFRNAKGLYYEGYIHETIDRCIQKRGGSITKTNIPIHHFKEQKPRSVISSTAKKYFNLEKLKNAHVFRDHYRHYFRIGRDYFLLNKDYGAALKYLERSIELQPDFSYSYFLIALIYERKKLYCETVSILKKALAIRDGYIGAHYLLGLVYDRLHELCLAEKEFNRALEISPSHPQVLNSLGVVLAKQRKIDAARKCFKKALKIKPVFQAAQKNLNNIRDMD